MTTATSKGGPFGRFGPFKFLSGAKNSIMDLGSDKKRKKVRGIDNVVIVSG